MAAERAAQRRARLRRRRADRHGARRGRRCALEVAQGLEGAGSEKPAFLDAVNMSGNLAVFAHRSASRCCSARKAAMRMVLTDCFPYGWDYRNMSYRRRLAGTHGRMVAAGVNPAAQAAQDT